MRPNGHWLPSKRTADSQMPQLQPVNGVIATKRARLWDQIGDQSQILRLEMRPNGRGS